MQGGEIVELLDVHLCGDVRPVVLFMCPCLDVCGCC